MKLKIKTLIATFFALCLFATLNGCWGENGSNSSQNTQPSVNYPIKSFALKGYDEVKYKGTISGNNIVIESIPTHATGDLVAVFVAESGFKIMVESKEQISGKTKNRFRRGSAIAYKAVNAKGKIIKTYNVILKDHEGTLRRLPEHGLENKEDAVAMVSSPDGRFVYVANNGLDKSSISIYKKDQNSGKLSFSESKEIDKEQDYLIKNISIAPDGRYAYILEFYEDAKLQQSRISACFVHADGSLSDFCSTVSLKDNYEPQQMKITPNGKYLYVTSLKSDRSYVSVYKIIYGQRIIKSGEDVQIPGQITSTNVTPDGNSIYFTTMNSQSKLTDAAFVFMYHINDETGNLEKLTPSKIALKSSVIGMTVSPDGKFAYLANFLRGSVEVYKIDEDGVLNSTEFKVDSGSYPVDVKITDNGKYLYVANFGSSSISMYNVDKKTGMIRAMNKSSIYTGRQPFSIVISPENKTIDNNFVYVLKYFNDKNDKGIRMFEID